MNQKELKKYILPRNFDLIYWKTKIQHKKLMSIAVSGMKMGSHVILWLSYGILPYNSLAIYVVISPWQITINQKCKYISDI